MTKATLLEILTSYTNLLASKLDGIFMRISTFYSTYIATNDDIDAIIDGTYVEEETGDLEYDDIVT